jgi:hypothetical protein
MQAARLSSQAFWLQVLCFETSNLDKFESHSSNGILLGYTPMVDLIECLSLRLTPFLGHMM